MDKWKGVSLVLVVLLGISVIFNIGLYQAAKEEITSLQEKVISGVHAEGNKLVIKNTSFSSVYIEPLGVWVLENGTKIFTKNRKLGIEIGFWGGIYTNDWKVAKIGKGIYSIPLNLNPGDGLYLSWVVVNGTPSNFVIRVLDDEGFQQYLSLMKQASYGDTEWWTKLDDVLTYHQVVSKVVKAGTGQAVDIGEGIRKSGVYHIVFENSGEPVVLKMRIFVEKSIDVSVNKNP